MKMSHREALKILDLPMQVVFEDIKKAYRIACGKYHPDRNAAGLEMMKLVNAAYESLSDYVSDGLSGDSDYVHEETLGDKLNAALNAIVGLEGIEIEICGSWIWVGGNTREHKEVLKEAGFRYAPKKVMWSYSGSGKRSFGGGRYDMDSIRSMHGSVGVKVRSYGRLAN
jgi:curved DNA-binding protein CbpA